MSKGYGKSDSAAQDVAARRERYESTSGVQMLSSKQVKEGSPRGGPLIVRFLEQGNDGPNAINAFDVHEYKEPSDKSKIGFFTQRVTCFSEIGQECPFCKAGLPRKVRGVFNLIVRDRAVLRRGADKKAIKNPDGSYVIDGHADQVCVLNVANTTLQMIKGCDHSYRGLMSRDLSLGPSGDQFQPYSLHPADIDSGPQTMSEPDQQLAAKRHDLDKIMAPPTLGEAAQIISKYGGNSGASQSHVPVVQPNQSNPFLAGAAAVPAGVTAGAFGAAQPQPQQAPPTPPEQQ